jgi:cell wall-associated NlpC family hydrolase
MPSLPRAALILTWFAISQGLPSLGRAQSHDTANDSGLTGETRGETNAPALTGAPPAATNAVPSPAPVAPSAPTVERHVASLSPSDLREFASQPPAVQRLLAQALDLTKLNLAYKYGSSDPKEGGMDCSGTVYYLLRQAGLPDVPRDASGMYRWVWTEGSFQSVVSHKDDTFELSRLKPGDLLFWTGTYQVERDPPVTHVMIYLGINRHSGRRTMVGASEGRRFNDQSQYGVSVFDFTLPGPRRPPSAGAETSSPTDPQSRFIGYGSIPGLEAVGAYPTVK